MVKNKHSIIRMLEILLIMLLIVSVMTVYNGVAFALDGSNSGTVIRGDSDTPADPADPGNPEVPDDPVNPDDPDDPDDPPEPPEPQPTDIADAVVTLSPDGFAYIGEPVIPEVTVTMEDKELILDTDYTLEITNNDAPGEGIVTVTGIGDYTGEVTITFMIVKGGWLLKGGKWYYIDSEGKYAASRWIRDSKGWCWLGSDGAMVTGKWISDKGSWYYIDDEGHMISNSWQKDGAGWCYVGSDGRMLTSQWIKSGGYWYYLKADGHMAAIQWAQDSKGWCYLNADGHIITDKWIKSGGYWYYLKPDGHMAANKWVKDSSGWCYVNSSGRMVAGTWVKTSGKWYYLKSDGHMATSQWIKTNGQYYWVYSSGRMADNGWAKTKTSKGACWNYFYSDGTYETDPYVFVSISEQHLYYCQRGDLVLSTDVVTGNKGNHDTPTGTFWVRGRQTDVILRGFEDDGEPYESHVDYWMPFLGGEYGLHDADWRWSFGGEIYKWNGSHGCVNMPPDAARRLFNMISVGTMVRIQ